MFWRSRRLFLGVLLVLLLSPIVFYTMERAKVIIEDLTATNRLVKKGLEDNVEQDKGRGCKVPQLEPFNEDVARFIENYPIVTCEGTNWVNCFKSECNVTKAILTTVKDIVCIYRDILYVDERKYYIGHPTKVIGKEKFSLNNSDHVKIDCTGKYVKSPELRARWSGYKAGLRPVLTDKIPSNPVDSYNIMILCFDSTSRNGFIRKKQNNKTNI